MVCHRCDEALASTVTRISHILMILVLPRLALFGGQKRQYTITRIINEAKSGIVVTVSTSLGHNRYCRSDDIVSFTFGETGLVRKLLSRPNTIGYIVVPFRIRL